MAHEVHPNRFALRMFLDFAHLVLRAATLDVALILGGMQLLGRACRPQSVRMLLLSV
jgi:hypothetical protein